MSDSVSRFTRTVENYVKYRPHYPYAIVEFLQEACQLTPSSVVADIASGTGFLAEIFLQHGNNVIGIEPNAEMRAAGQHYLRNYPRFTSVAATAEDTTLESHSINMITAGQAFHWFDKAKSRQEFLRILKPHGWALLAWNIARDDTPFMAAYNQRIWKNFLAPAAENTGTDNQAIEADLRAWYAPGTVNFKRFANSQIVDFEGLRGRTLSSSYSPTPEDPKYETLLSELEALFKEYEVNGQVVIEYECKLCFGRLQ